ncbi:MAG: hypothetical protein AB1551_01630 [Actinomycetota bacterium]
MSDVNGPRRAVESAFSRIAAEEESLLRVRRGLYWKGVKSRFGPGRPKTEDIVREVAGPRGLGPTAWSASHALGLSTQVPAVPEFAMVGPPPTGIREVNFHSRRNFARLGLGYEEIALLEVLRDWPEHADAEWADVERTVSELRNDGRIRLDRVGKAVAGERAPVLKERIARLVTDLGSHASGNASMPV